MAADVKEALHQVIDPELSASTSSTLVWFTASNRRTGPSHHHDDAHHAGLPADRPDQPTNAPAPSPVSSKNSRIDWTWQTSLDDGQDRAGRP